MRQKHQQPTMAVSLEEAAGMISISEQHMRRLVKRGAMPASKVGDRVLIEIANLKAFLAERRILR